MLLASTISLSKMRRKKQKKIFWPALLVLLALSVALGWFTFNKLDRHYLKFQPQEVKQDFWGITFSTKYARELNLDWRQTYTVMLDDLQVKNIRLPVYWDEIERSEGQYDFSDYDWLISQGEKRQVDFILVLGRRQPRWPECHQPLWTDALSAEKLQEKQLAMLAAAANHFKSYQNITAWQIENEFFVDWFGTCDRTDKKLIDREIKLMRQIDSRPILLTDSGEFSLWIKVGSRADLVGATMYRVAWNEYLGYLYSAWPSWIFRAKSQLIGHPSERMMIAELQAEPWPSNFRHVKDLKTNEIGDSFTIEQLFTNAEVARRTGFDQAYFWGAEWWYSQMQKNNPVYWQAAKAIISTGNR